MSNRDAGHGAVIKEEEVTEREKERGKSLISGEVFIGVGGKKTSVIQVIRLICDVNNEDTRDDTLFNFMMDMCRKVTDKGAPKAMFTNRNLEFKEEFAQLGLLERVCRIYAVQPGVAAPADGSLVQRIGRWLQDHGRASIPLRQLRVFNKAGGLKLEIEWPTTPHPDYDFHDMHFPMGGELEEEGAKEEARRKEEESEKERREWDDRERERMTRERVERERVKGEQL
jgi:hypothetical protein